MATLAYPLTDEALPTGPIALEEYLSTSYEPDCDFVDGYLEERNSGDESHGELQIAIGAWFFNRRKEWKIRVASEYRTRVAGTRVRIPDVMVYADDGIRQPVRGTPPLLCVEILSPDDRKPRVARRLADFHAMGVNDIWVLDPATRSAFLYTAEGLSPTNATRLHVSDSPVFLDLVEVFSVLD